MKERDYLWCLVHELLDGEEQLERLCPECRTRAEQEHCPACGRPAGLSGGGEGAENGTFDAERFRKLARGEAL
jgi:predicted amidophosphoribosyltransferase